MEDTLQPFIRNTGPSLSPFNAWLLLKGLETLPLRVDAACRAARAVADFLAGAARSVTRVCIRRAPTIRSTSWRWRR